MGSIPAAGSMGYNASKWLLYGIALLAVICMFYNAHKKNTATSLAFGIIFIGALMEVQTLIFQNILHLIHH